MPDQSYHLRKKYKKIPFLLFSIILYKIFKFKDTYIIFLPVYCHFINNFRYFLFDKKSLMIVYVSKTIDFVFAT